jgi:hypothetical protein
MEGQKNCIQSLPYTVRGREIAAVFQPIAYRIKQKNPGALPFSYHTRPVTPHLP